MSCHFLSPIPTFGAKPGEEKCWLGDARASCLCHYAYVVRSMPSRGGKRISKSKCTGSRAHSRDVRVKKAAQRLRKLQASGVALSEILGGEAGAEFVREDCEGDPDVAAAAFALIHSPRGQGDRGEEGRRRGPG